MILLCWQYPHYWLCRVIYQAFLKINPSFILIGLGRKEKLAGLGVPSVGFFFSFLFFKIFLSLKNLKTPTLKSFKHFGETVWSSLKHKGLHYKSSKWKKGNISKDEVHQKKKESTSSLIFIFLHSLGIGFLMLKTLLLIFGVTWAFEESSSQFFFSMYSYNLLLLEVVSASCFSLVMHIM